ncbi:AAA family ATPase [Nocardioides sediminis]|uniref:AAA family ATPase n=1 Tax=Nocardioides sediminis TaxID=433648 RepID=UPI00131ED96C|nr:AAA family ATPase [Nocardioides sediminis]
MSRWHDARVSARLLVVVSGLPASGKTTVGRALADHLSLPLLDKDQILEALFDGLGCEDQQQRHRLSRASDEVLLRLAASTEAAIVVNWWDHDTAPGRLLAIADEVVEVFCDCPVEVAVARFAARRRHPGHLDHLRTPADHERVAARLRESYRGPLMLGDTVVTIDTGGPVDLGAVVETVRAALPESIRLTASS